MSFSSAPRDATLSGKGHRLKAAAAVAIFCLCMALGLPAPAFARQKPETLRVAFNELPPWKITGRDGRPGGIEFLKLLTQRMGLETEFVVLPFKRGLKMLETGEVDLMTGILRRPNREPALHFIEPAYKTGSDKAFFVLKGSEGLLSSHEDLHALEVGTQLGTKYYPQFDNDAAISVRAVKEIDLNIKMLLAGRIDTFIITETVGDYHVARRKLGHRIAKAKFAYRKQIEVHMAVSKKSRFAARLDEFNRVMQDLLDQGEFDRIKAEFIARECE